MKQTILARRYAKALFAVGKEKNTFETYREVLLALKDVYANVPEMAAVLTNPLYPMDLREKAMAGIVASLKVDKIMGNFLGLLVQKKRAEILPDIADEFSVMVDNEKNICHGHVISAVSMNSKLHKKVKTTLEKLTGKKVELTTSVDPTIIGGIIAKVGDLVLDGSIKTQLASLKDTIKGRE